MTFDKNATKPEIQKKIDELVGTYPELAEINTTMTKQEMIDRAEAIIGTKEEDKEVPAIDTAPKDEQPAPVDTEALTDVEKAEALARLLEKRPEAMLVPARQAIYRIPHPNVPGKKFEISVFGDQVMGSALVPKERVMRRWRTPEDRPTQETMRVGGVKLADIPDWVKPQIYDFINSGEIRLVTDEAAAQKLADPAERKRAILDVTTGEIGMKVVYAENTGLNVEHRPIIVEPRGEFTRGEQQAAWRVLNEVVEGERPLPTNWEVISEDPRHLHPQEVLHVVARIRRCLENPERFMENPPAGGFDERVFFNQLLECEYKGFTPQRQVAGSKNGGTRPEILREIRKIAASRGFEVVGDYVRHKVDREIKEDVIPTVPFTRQTPVSW